jgi:hypothetical protein
MIKGGERLWRVGDFLNQEAGYQPIEMESTVGERF